MKRVINSLNEISFDLPEDWQVTEDRYILSNGQGFLNRENYLSKSGKVISLFEVYRDPDEFFEYYQKLVEDYTEEKDGYKLEKQFTLKLGEFEFPVYIIKGFKEIEFFFLQAFVNCGDRLACFMITLDKVCENPKEMIKQNETFSALVKILRTVE